MGGAMRRLEKGLLTFHPFACASCCFEKQGRFSWMKIEGWRHRDVPSARPSAFCSIRRFIDSRFLLHVNRRRQGRVSFAPFFSRQKKGARPSGRNPAHQISTSVSRRSPDECWLITQPTPLQGAQCAPYQDVMRRDSSRHGKMSGGSPTYDTFFAAA